MRTIKFSGSVQCALLTRMRLAHSPHPPTPTWTLFLMPPRVLHPQRVLFERHFIVSGSRLRLPAAKRTQARTQREMMGRGRAIQTSSAKDLNSHALPCRVSNKKRILASIRLRSNRFGSPVLLTRRAWRLRAWRRRCDTPRSWDTAYLRSEHQAWATAKSYRITLSNLSRFSPIYAAGAQRQSPCTLNVFYLF